MVNTLKSYVVIATKGRPKDIPILLNYLLEQTILPERIIFVGTDASDFGKANIKNKDQRIEFLISEHAALTAQRNVGKDRVLDIQGKEDDFIIVYFDDDFRPRKDWIEEALKCFSRKSIAGLTGEVLADGINGWGISEEAAQQYLKEERPPNKSHWTVRFHNKEVESTYGCNMAFSGQVSREVRFDDNLPAYAWLEDKDYSFLSESYGKVWCDPACKGVHLGTKRGRISGLKFGYSQIANPVYLRRKGTLSVWHSFLLIGGNIFANHAKAFFPEEWVDRKGRVKGNWMAILDFFKGQISPSRINDM